MKKLNALMVCNIVLSLFGCSSASSVDNSTIPSLDLQKYLGKWYELARFDHKFERGLSHCTALYTLQPNGTIRVQNQGVKNDKPKESIGKAKTTETAGLLRVSFFGPFYGDYRVMMLASDYSYALVGSGNSKYLWILSRTPQLPQETLDLILTEAQRRGYDTSKLIWVPQGEE